MNPASKQRITKIGLFKQTGGWVFIVTDSDFFCEPISSGKRKTLELAMAAAREKCPAGVPIVYCRVDNLNDWEF